MVLLVCVSCTYCQLINVVNMQHLAGLMKLPILTLDCRAQDL